MIWCPLRIYLVYYTTNHTKSNLKVAEPFGLLSLIASDVGVVMLLHQLDHRTEYLRQRLDVFQRVVPVGLDIECGR